MTRRKNLILLLFLTVWVFTTQTGMAQGPTMPQDLKFIGEIQPRSANQIISSNWSVGAETMCRDFTIYRHWREYLGPLGVKSARIQSGWAKTEKEKGVYNWEWLDEIIPDMVAQGVKPWVCLCYGNSIYPGGGSAAVSSRLPLSSEARQGWLNFVKAFVGRYADTIDEWEIWNEPLYQNISTPQYADFYIKTAEAIRSVQPTAKLFGIASAGVDVDSTDKFMAVLQQQNKLGLINAVTYHPYYANPDDAYPAAEALRAVVQKYSPNTTIFQGESGAPSTNITYGALSGNPWTELTQAKWLLRRLLGDLGRNIRSSYFSIADMHYQSNGGLHMNTKGLLLTRPDKTVERPKPAYRAFQHITALFDNTIKQQAFTSKNNDTLCIFGYKKASGENSGKCMYTLWRPQEMPKENLEMPATNLQLPAAGLENPVWVDMYSGKVYSMHKNMIKRKGDTLVLKNVPVGDWPIVIAEAGLVPLINNK